MKQHLTNLLNEQYTQETLIDNLYNMGVDLMDISIDNLTIVLDIIGFPKDNSAEYALYVSEIDDSLEHPDADLFDREWLLEEYSVVVNALRDEEQVRVREDGKVQVIPGPSDDMIQEKLSNFVDWLYSEYELYKSENS